jgi:hypothetical protein
LGINLVNTGKISVFTGSGATVGTMVGGAMALVFHVPLEFTALIAITFIVGGFTISLFL